MRKKIIIIIYVVVSFILLFFIRQENSDIFVLGRDFFDYFKIFLPFTILATATYILIKTTRKKEFSNIQFYSFWLTALIVMTITFQFIKYDSQPFDGPIDSIIYKNFNEEHRKQDSIYLVDGYPDSTISETTSIDTNKNGIYIWLNHKELFVRKHTTNFNSQRQEDSVTMSIVRRWNK
jgi:hypothetical protein